MLNFEEKIQIFESLLLSKNDSYADFMKDEIYFYFFENHRGFDFLKGINTHKELEDKMEFIISKMIRHEHEEGLLTIIEEYLATTNEKQLN
jgi:hypothetical protein